MSHSTDIRDNKVIVHLSGAIYSKEAALLREDLIHYITKGYYRFLFDFSQVNDIDSTGLGVIVTVRKRAIANGGSVVVNDLPPRAKELFNRTRLNKILATSNV
ncbi:anti-sigma B factor antagonist [Evansella vedderi]|uniref:Anti-sigma B factor antagonist n=1 Tax=Evansella vedderi TaxID=38282 RepID=A0ABT9ZQN0_9BACI|nr:STAS domain-containing protein [Evansella vedderi]MDQ0253548.1 anti-sigma B factor antagonist [Evansella vedderi]